MFMFRELKQDSAEGAFTDTSFVKSLDVILDYIIVISVNKSLH